MSTSVICILVLAAVTVIALIYAAGMRYKVSILRGKVDRGDRKTAGNNQFIKILTGNLSSNQDVTEWMNELARYASEEFNAESVCIYKLENGEFCATASCGPYPDIAGHYKQDQNRLTRMKYLPDKQERKNFRPDDGLLGEIASKPVLINSPHDERLLSCKDQGGLINSIMTHPLMDGPEIGGVLIVVNSKSEEGFSEEQFKNLKEFSERVMLVQKIIDFYIVTSKQQRIKQELEFARNLQLSLLPQEFPEWGGFKIQAFTRAAKDVSGDFYDFVRIDEDRLLVVIGDACGKGIPACMIMAMTRAFIRSAAANFTTLEHLLHELNENLYRDTSDGRYITLGCCVLDKRETTIEYARAGHTPLLMCLRHHIRKIDPEGSGLGLLPDELARFDTLCTEVSAGTSMLLFTDGINEATDVRDEFYGIDRTTETYFRSCEAGNPPTDIIQNILNDVAKYTAGKENTEQEDDQTIVLIQYN